MSVTRKQWESLIGKLIFVAKCILPRRLFVARLLNVLRGLIGQNPTFVLNEETDLVWWSSLVDQFNGVSIIPDIQWAWPDTVLVTMPVSKELEVSIGSARNISILLFPLKLQNSSITSIV